MASLSTKKIKTLVSLFLILSPITNPPHPHPPGPQQIEVTYDDVPIPQSPLTVNAMPGCDASRVKAYGPGESLF